jgi:hypothetical protein
MTNSSNCQNKNPHSHLVHGQTFECEKGVTEEPKLSKEVDAKTCEPSISYDRAEKERQVWIAVVGQAIDWGLNTKEAAKFADEMLEEYKKRFN